MILSEESKVPEQTLETVLTDDEDEPDKLDIVPFKSSLNEQNSFINVIINSFFYKKEIMQFFETEEPPMQDSYRLLYELQSIFDQMRKLTSPIYFKKTTKERRFLDTSFIKHELKYQFNGRFFNPHQSGNASDILNIFYNALHMYFSGEDNIVGTQTTKCVNKNCLSHNLAYVDIASQIYCSLCKKRGILYKYPVDTYYYPIDTNAVLTKLYEELDNDLLINKLFELEKTIHDENFQNDENETFSCDCRIVNKKNFKNNLIMLQSHKYFAVSLLWKVPPKFEDICRVFLTIPQYFKNTDLFHIYNDFDVQDYILQGIIVVDANNNKHVSFFIDNEIETSELYEKLKWHFCNENETKVMSSYIEVIEWCLFNNFYPVLLFYNYLDKNKIKEAKNIEFTKEQIDKYIHHCALVDQINSVTYTNIKLKKETLHPTLKDAYTCYDNELIEKINEIKQDESKGNKKFNFVEELEREKEKEALEEVYPKEDEIRAKTFRRPKNLEKFTKGKNDYYFDKDINIETFRKYPYKREGNWICSNCDNINNPSTFECVKCKLIDMGIFAKIDDEKNERIKKINQKMEKKAIKSNRSKSGNKKRNQFDQYTKKCLNCGNYYINKCFKCQESSENSKCTFSQIRDENEMDQVKFVYNRASKTIRNENKTKTNYGIYKEWKCKYCQKVNNGKFQFCIKCKMNK